MTQALIHLSEEANRVLNLVKAKQGLKDKSQAVEVVIEHFVECEGEPNLKQEFIERINRAEKGKFVRVKSFAKHFGVK